MEKVQQAKRQRRASTSTTTQICADDPQPGTSRDSIPWVPQLPQSPEPNPRILDGFICRPSQEEFKDPFEYIKNITKEATKYGIIKIIPPAGFYPSCQFNDVAKFKTHFQYPDKMLNRWGIASREVTTIHANLTEQKLPLNRPPTVEGLEVNLIKLHNVVEQLGGILEVDDRHMWPRVLDLLNYPRDDENIEKLTLIYYALLLPYDSMQLSEKLALRNRVEQARTNHLHYILERSQDPLHNKRAMLGEAGDLAKVIREADKCVDRGKEMTMNQFTKAAELGMNIYFPGDRYPSVDEMEEKYWNIVTNGTEQVCVISAAFDNGESNFGFPKQAGDEYAKHLWNLKEFNNQPESILRPMGAVLNVTVPTLNLGMIFTTSCWHRDIHCLSRIDYMHTGTPKIWYGIPESQTDDFRRAMDVLCPGYCQNKPIWLPADVAMIPPCMFENFNIKLTKVVQNPGEFVIVFPKAFSCSVCTGFTASESVLFGTSAWLQDACNVFKAARESCEPTMFPLEHLLLSMVKDKLFPPALLPTLTEQLEDLIRDERKNRRTLMDRLVPMTMIRHTKRKGETWDFHGDLSKCDICRSLLYLSKVSNVDSTHSVHCLHHTLTLLKDPKISVANSASGVFHISQHKIDDIMHLLNSRNRARYPADHDFTDDSEGSGEC